MKATISFKIPTFNSFGTKEISFKTLESKEATFKGILKSFTKTLDKNWESVEFEFQGECILICRHWLEETDDFEQSHQVGPLNINN